MADHRQLKQDVDELLKRVGTNGLITSGTNGKEDILSTALAIPTLAERGFVELAIKLVEKLSSRRDFEGGWDDPWTTLLATEGLIGLRLRGIPVHGLEEVIDQAIKALKNVGTLETSDRELRLARVLVLDGLSRRDARRIDSGLIRARAAVDQGINFDATKSDALHGLLSLVDLFLVTSDSATRELVDKRSDYMQLRHVESWSGEDTEVLARAGVVAEKLQLMEQAQKYYELASGQEAAELSTAALKHRVELGARLYGEALAQEKSETPAEEVVAAPESVEVPEAAPVVEPEAAIVEEEPVQAKQELPKPAAKTNTTSEDYSSFPAYHDPGDEIHRGVSVILLHGSDAQSLQTTLEALNRQTVLPVDVTIVHTGNYRLDTTCAFRFDVRQLVVDSLDTEGRKWNQAAGLSQGDWLWVLPEGLTPKAATIQAVLQSVENNTDAVFLEADEGERIQVMDAMAFEPVIGPEQIFIRRTSLKNGFNESMLANPIWPVLLTDLKDAAWVDCNMGNDVGFDGEVKVSLDGQLNTIHDFFRLSIMLDDSTEIVQRRGEKAQLYRRLAYEEYRRAGKPLVSIVIPHYNLPDMLEKCIDSIVDNTEQVSFEIIVVDNGSDNTSKELIDKLEGYGVLYLRNRKNEGFARAVNRGIREAHGEYVLLLNNDTEVRGGWLQAMMAAQQETGAEIVGARLHYPDGSVQHAGIVFDHEDIPSHIYAKGPSDLPMIYKRRYFQAVTAACMMVKRDVYLRLGGMDEGYRNGWEDVDFCLRARQQGFRIVYEPGAELVHYTEQTSGRKDHEEDNARRFLMTWGGRIEQDLQRYANLDGFDVEIRDGKSILKPNDKAQQAYTEFNASQLGINVNREKPVAAPAPYTPKPPKTEEENLSDLIARADLMIKEGNFEDAEETLKGGAHKVNGNVKQRALYWTLLGDARFRLERSDDALDCYKRAVNDDPSAQRAWVGIGTYHLVHDELEQAEDIFGKVVKLAPDFDRGYMGMGNVMLRRKEFGSALDYFLEAARIAPDHRPAIVGMVAAAMQAGRLGEAQSPIETYLQSHPDDVETRFHFAAILFSEKDVDRAREEAQKVLELNPEHKGAIQMMNHLSALT